MAGNNWARLAAMASPFGNAMAAPSAPRRRRKSKTSSSAPAPKRRKAAKSGNRLKKGSAAAKAYMARLRKLRRR